MEKMFKRTLLGAAVAIAAGSANAAIELNGQAVQMYGQAAGFMHFVNNDNADDMAVQAVIESRVGLRGTVQFDNFAPDLVWQIESGDANNTSYGAWGGRDTFLGLAFDGVGTFKYGRQLVAAYNYVDWPHTNPGLGNVFDWHNGIDASFEDRANNVLRFDSATWGGFNFQATLSNMDKTVENMAISVAASYTNDMMSVHAGHYLKQNGEIAGDAAKNTDGSVIKDKDGNIVADPAGAGYVAATPAKVGDMSYSIVGGSFFVGPVTLTAAYKMMDNDANNDSQDAVSATAQYVNGSWVFKAGYAQTFESDKGNNNDSTAITGRIGYLLPSTYLYMDVRSYDMYKDADDATNVLIGAEYYF